MTTELNSLTFGIEFETTMPYGAVIVGGYARGEQVAWLPEGWQAKHDGSIRAGRGRQGCEFVSPVLRGEEGLQQVVQVVEAIRAHGGRVNRSTGLHVHVGFDRTNRPALQRLVTLVSNFERAIYASTGTKARERGQWCGGIQRHSNAADAIARAESNRYHLLNLTNLASGRRQTVEFRPFAGTLNTVKVISHVRTCLGLVQRALDAKRITQWAAKQPSESSPMHRSGEGQTHLARLFYQLGWIKGRQSRTFGVVEGAGLPSLRSTRRMLMKMARKYDQQ